MNRAALAEQLERLGNSPAPLPDPRRVQQWERELYRDFVQPATPVGTSASAGARRRRRQVLVGSLAVAAAGCLAAFVLQRGSPHRVDLDAASGAVVLLPDGSSRPLHAGDEIPPGGVVRTGPDGSVTIDGTRVGADQALVVDDGRLILLPTPTTVPTESTSIAPATAATPAPSSLPTPAATRTRETPAPPPRQVSSPVPAPSADATSPPTVAPSTDASTSPAPPAEAPAPAGAAMPQLQLTVSRAAMGVRLSWTSTQTPDFDRYVVVRGPGDAPELHVIAELPDRQITSFTDPAAPLDIDLVYRVLVLDAAGRPIAMSPTAMLEFTASSTSDPPRTDPDPTDPATTDAASSDPSTSIAPVTGPPASEPPATDPGPDTTVMEAGSTTSRPSDGTDAAEPPGTISTEPSGPTTKPS